MNAAPNATLVVNRFMTERMGQSLQVSPLRQRWVADGESLDVGDRVLRAVRPPIFDSPTTRGLFDPTTGVYWGVDSFATPMPAPVADVADLPAEGWLPGMAQFDNYVAPWLRLVDDRRYQATVDRVAELDPKVLVGCHTPVIGGDHVARAIEATRGAPTATFAPEPDQAVLQEIQRALGGLVATPLGGQAAEVSTAPAADGTASTRSRHPPRACAAITRCMPSITRNTSPICA